MYHTDHLKLLDALFTELWAVCKEVSKDTTLSDSDAIEKVFSYFFKLVDEGDAEVGIPPLSFEIPYNEKDAAQYAKDAEAKALTVWPCGVSLNKGQTCQLLFDERRLGSNPVINCALKMTTVIPAEMSEGRNRQELLISSFFTLFAELDGVGTFFPEVIIAWEVDGKHYDTTATYLHDCWYPAINGELDSDDKEM